jgi:hypothetical protein
MPKLSDYTKFFGVCVSALGVIGILFGAWFYLETKFATAEEMNQLKQRLDYKITADQYNQVQERIWKIEDRYRGKKMDDTVQEEYRQLLEQKVTLKDELNKMSGNKTQTAPAKK